MSIMISIPTDLLKSAMTAAPAKDPRKMLVGVHVTRDEAGLCVVEATDGKVLIRHEYNECADPVTGAAVDLVIPHDTVKQALRTCGKGDNFVSVEIEGSCCKLMTASTTILFSAPDGQYPRTQTVIPNAAHFEESVSVALSAEVLEYLMKQAKLKSYGMGCVTLVLPKPNKDYGTGKGVTTPILYCIEGRKADCATQGLVMPVKISGDSGLELYQTCAGVEKYPTPEVEPAEVA